MVALPFLVMISSLNIGLSSPTEDVSAFLHSRMMHAIDGLESRAISEAANAMSRADVSIRKLDDWWSQYDSLMELYKQNRTVHICSNRPLLESTLDQVKQQIALVRNGWEAKATQLEEIRALLNHTDYMSVTGLYEALNSWLTEQEESSILEGQRLEEEEEEVQDEEQTLTHPVCPCVWGEWSDWTECSTTCGTGTIMRQREVDTPATNGGGECQGQEILEENCLLKMCPVDCEWGIWTQWTDCSVTCGDGVNTRTRSHVTEAKYDGEPCEGESEENRHCNKYEELEQIIIANKARILELQQQNGGTDTTDDTDPDDPPTEVEPEEPPPPEEEEVSHCTAWGEWDSWSGCNKQCGSGTMNRTRTAITEDGETCGTTFAEHVLCNTNSCDAHEVWINTTGMKSGYCFDDFCTDSEVCSINPSDVRNPAGYNNIGDTEEDTMQYDPEAGADGFVFSDTYGGIYAADSGANGAILTPNLGSTNVTLALLLKHDEKESYTAQEVFQENALVISSGVMFPDVSVQVMDGADVTCSATFTDVYSTVEYILIAVVIDGTNISLYRNGVSKGSQPCSHQVGASSGGIHIGRNHFAGVIRSFAFWDRALELTEIMDLDIANLIC